MAHAGNPVPLPPIRVTIDRIEVRARGAEAERPRAATRSDALSLEAYLKSREEPSR
jgi:hypothetical protein